MRRGCKEWVTVRVAFRRWGGGGSVGPGVGTMGLIVGETALAEGVAEGRAVTEPDSICVRDAVWLWVGTLDAVAVTTAEDDALRVAVAPSVAVREARMLAVALADRERDALGVGVGGGVTVTVAVRVPVGVAVIVADCESVRVTERCSVAVALASCDADAVADREAVGVGGGVIVVLELCVADSVRDGESDEASVGDTECELLLERDGESDGVPREGDCDAVGVGDKLTDGERDIVGDVDVVWDRVPEGDGELLFVGL